MFHTSHIHVPRNRRPSALRTFITSSSFGPPDTKEPLRRGILLTAVAFVLLLIGSILTWLGFNDVFGGRMSMTGPLLIALSLLLLLLSFRQFLLARKRNNTTSRSSMQLDSVNRESMTAVVVNRDDGLHPATIIVDRYNRIANDGGITVHRHWEEDCAPPSYQEVTRFSSRSDTPCTAPDDQDELPPTYEETMYSTLYQPAHLPPAPSTTTTPVRPDRNNPLALAAGSEMGPGVGGVAVDRDMLQSNVAGQMFARLSQKPLLSVKGEMGGGVEAGGRRGGPGVAVGSSSAGGIVIPLPRHGLSLLPPPSQHMSAPASPRQLSAPPSPHPFSAPPSPRQVSPPRLNVTPPPLHSSSSLQLSNFPPPSLHMLPASPSPSHMFSRPSSPNFSAPSSPRPSLPGQQQQQHMGGTQVCLSSSSSSDATNLPRGSAADSSSTFASRTDIQANI
ncbi:uncharacterized protein LOC143296550 [Babylonia areolata]|uniref:uncharacterized protein LOC143296550 n=1 Tax=Babylonia areolata TaxID=304850 RepID=UPI003FD34080